MRKTFATLLVPTAGFATACGGGGGDGGAGRVVMSCTEAMSGSRRRFVDGVSVALTFETSPVQAIAPPR